MDFTVNSSIFKKNLYLILKLTGLAIIFAFIASLIWPEAIVITAGYDSNDSADLSFSLFDALLAFYGCYCSLVFLDVFIAYMEAEYCEDKGGD